MNRFKKLKNLRKLYEENQKTTHHGVGGFGDGWNVWGDSDGDGWGWNKGWFWNKMKKRFIRRFLIILIIKIIPIFLFIWLIFWWIVWVFMIVITMLWGNINGNGSGIWEDGVSVIDYNSVDFSHNFSWDFENIPLGTPISQGVISYWIDERTWGINLILLIVIEHTILIAVLILLVRGLIFLNEICLISFQLLKIEL